MNFANEIKASVSAKEVAEFYGYAPNRSGFICCPFHGEDTPSLKAYDGQGGWHCFGCGAHGDVTDLVARLFDLPFLEAQAKINEDFRLGLPIGKILTEEERRQAEERARAWQKKQADKMRRINEAETAYIIALDLYAELDMLVHQNAPKRGAQSLEPMFLDLLDKRNKAIDMLDKAEGKYYSILMAEKG